jgi:hypothetical protein
MAMTDASAFQIAGFADSSNQMGRRVKASEMLVPPQIQALGDRLVWGHMDRREITWVTPGNRMISDFVKLASATSTEPFVRFAKRYGVFFAEERPLEEGESLDALIFGNKLWRVSDPFARNWEPIEFWREVSRYVQAILRIAAQLREIPPRTGDRKDWRVLGDEGPSLDPGQALFLLELEVDTWLRAGNVRLTTRARYESERQTSRTIWWTEVVCGSWFSSLFGSIALQLMLLIAGSETLYTCTGCGVPYLPAGRRPKHGQNSYCDDCGLERAKRDADRRRKDKMIEARRLHAEGVAPEEIADRLNVRSVASVRRWLKKGRPNVKKARPG